LFVHRELVGHKGRRSSGIAGKFAALGRSQGGSV
jgi:hypothetical protein